MKWYPRMTRLHRQIRTQARYAYSQEEESGMSYVRKSGLPTPRQVKQYPHPWEGIFSESRFQLVKYLDQFVVGQTTAKKVLSVA